MWKRTFATHLGGRPRPYLAALAVVLPGLFVGCAKLGTETSNHRTVPTNYVEGSFVLTADSSSDAEGLKSSSDSVASELGCRVSAFDQINWGSEETTGVLSQEMKNTYNVRFENCDFSKEGTSSILAKFESQTGVTGAEAEALAAATPIVENDPNKTSQGHLKFIKRDQACSASERNNKKPVVVAVVDSGVDMNHVDLKDMFYTDSNGRVIGANFVGAGSSMGSDDNWDDKAGHGTHVAGIIGAMSDNGRGIVGVGACANIKIMPVRVLNENGTGSSIEIERGVKWAADHGAHIINLSLGFTSISYQTNTSHYRSIYADLAKRDIIVFAAAGNDGFVNGSDVKEGGRRFYYPSSYQNVISVAATNDSGTLTSFSNRGELVDIAAPGYNILSTTMDGSYGRKSGTSMATPVAAGAFALALASAEQGFAENVDRIDTKIVESLLSQSVLSNARLEKSAVLSGGVLDVEKLVKASMAKFPKIEEQPADEPVDEPVTPDTGIIAPVTPEPQIQPQPQPQPVLLNFEFAGLTEGQKAGNPQSLEVQNLPAGTSVVYFYWGDSYWSFTKVAVTQGVTTAKDADEWYLYGNRTLTAVAFNKYGRVLKQIKVRLTGLR